MTKLKTPLMSLRASGPLGQLLSFDNRSGQRRVRTLPIPSNPKTLLQTYQRWLYQDYCAYWQTLPAATKQLWETNARPYHMTGFAYWLKTHLSTLPDIAAAWHLDTITGTSVKDFSKNAYHATVYGASITTGLISNALHFDGIDDYIESPFPLAADAPLNITTGTFMLFTKYTSDGIIITKGMEQGDTHSFRVGRKAAKYEVEVWTPAYHYFETATTTQDWQHFTLTYDGTDAKVYLNAVLTSQVNAPGAFPATIRAIHLGCRRVHAGFTVSHFGGEIDEPRIYNRVLSQPEIQKHAERRYP